MKLKQLFLCKNVRSEALGAHGTLQYFVACFQITTKRLLSINSVRPGTNTHFLSLSLSLSRRAYARFSQQKKTCAYRSTVLALQTVIHEAVLLPIFLPYLLTISLYSLQINGSCFLVPVIYYSKKLH